MLKIKWYGHSCFVLKFNEFVVVTDPFDSCVNYKLPDVIPDIITVSHYHGDHSDPEFLKKASIIDENNPFFENSEVKIKGHHSFHDNNNGAERGDNTIFHFEFSGISLLHLGDLGGEMPEISGLSDNLIIMAPFGGIFTIDGYQSLKIAERLNAKYLIPMHYKTDKVDFELKKLSDYNIDFIRKDSLIIETANDLPDRMQIIELNYDFQN